MTIPPWLYAVAAIEALLGIAALYYGRHRGSLLVAVIGAVLLADAVIGPALLASGVIPWPL
jgi:hypothetical protein